MSGATANLPTLEGTQAVGGAAQGGLSGFLDLLGSLGSDSGSSPISGVFSAMGGLEGRLDIDMSGLGERLPQAMTTIRNALPADSLRYVEEIEGAYRTLMDFLQNSELAKQVRQGSNLEATALAVVEDLLSLFRTRLGELAANLVGAEDLNRVREALQLLHDLREDFSAHSGELLPFLSRNLLGVPPDFLAGATAQVEVAVSVLQPLSEASLQVQVGPARAVLAVAGKDLAEAVRAFDPADPAQYGGVESRLAQLESALDVAFDALEACYGGLEAAVDSHAWEAVFTAYRDVLEALPLEDIPTVDDAVEGMAAVLEEFLARLSMAFSPEDVAGRITRLSESIQNTFAESPVGQARQILLGFLDTIREAIEGVPTEAIQAAVEQMLERIGAELDSLGISSIRATVEGAFNDAQEFLDENLGPDLLQEVQQALDGVLQELQAIPIAEAGQELAGAVDGIGSVVEELETAIEEGLEEIRALLARMEELSFRPVADEVIDEIDAVKARLQGMRPESLSDVEKLAIQAGMAVLRAVDLQGMIEGQLKNGFAALADEIKGLVNRIIAAWEDLRRRLGDFDPESVMGPLMSMLGQLTGALAQINAGQLLSPLYAKLEELKGLLSAMSPGAILDPLQAPYAGMMEAVDRINPDVWVAPLRDLYTEIDKLIGYVDITPLLDQLDQKEKELFAEARQAILTGMDSVSLPPPLDAFYAQIKLVAMALTDALFGDPEQELGQINVNLRQNVKLSALFQPLDAAFEEILKLVDRIPRADLTSAMDALRVGIGTALPALDPSRVIARLREGQGKLNDLAPTRAAAVLAALPAMKASLAAKLELAPAGNQAAAVSLSARFDAVMAPARMDLEASRLRSLSSAHDSLARTLRLKINSLEATGAQAAYSRLQANLGRLLPAFLMESDPLTYERIRAGLSELRPSRKARRLDVTLDRFMAQLKPMEGALQPAVNGFFRALKDTALLIHPLTLKDAVAGIYDALRSKVRVLDPDELAASLRENVYEPLIDPLKALDPAALKAQIDGLFQNLVASLAGKVEDLLDQVRQALDNLLAEVREAVTLVLDAITAQIRAILEKLAGILDRLDALVMEELFGRLLRVIDNLKTSFNQELDRVSHAFDAMLDAVPVGGGSGASATVGA